MANVKIPYALIPAVALDVRRANMQSAIARNLPRLTRATASHPDALSIACYGPSLKETWQDLRPPIISMSGATKFLADRGIIPDYHLDMDPRENKVMTSLPAVPGVTYLVASCCAPAYFDALLEAGANVVLWHTVSSNWQDELAWVSQHDPGQLVISTGSTMGLGAIQMGGILGYTRFEIHGMDGSFAEGDRHAGPHHGRVQKADITWDAGKVTYRTSKIMANAVAETINTAKNFPIITVWHGKGLTQALIRESGLTNACCADETEKRAGLKCLTPKVAPLPPMQTSHQSFWRALLEYLHADDLPDLVRQIPICEARREKAVYNTGSVPLETSLLLRALCRYYHPEVIAEVGTFIGTSTHAMIASRVTYTCDKDNDCVPLTESTITHPKQTSTAMLSNMQEKVDLFFFDGRIQDEDLPHIQRLSHSKTVYAFDDAIGQEKGVANIKKMAPLFTNPILIPPPAEYQGRSTLAAMIQP